MTATLRFAGPMVTVLGLMACASHGCPESSAPQTGAQLFRANCVACHGTTAHGDGPVADIIDVRVPDLTLIASRHGGTFPTDEIYHIVDGQSDMPAHGSRHMPIWGYEFFGGTGDDESEHGQAVTKVDNIVAYLQTLQQPR
jgi:mono/diheme cytochrome c family protein